MNFRQLWRLLGQISLGIRLARRVWQAEHALSRYIEALEKRNRTIRERL